MSYSYRFRVSWALAFILVLAACSTPKDLTSPTLELQFGAAYDDVGVDVAIAPNGNPIVFAEESGRRYDTSTDQDTNFERLLWKRYDRSGNLLRSRELLARACDQNDPYDYCELDEFVPRALLADGQGYTYALFSIEYYQILPGVERIRYNVLKIDGAGRVAADWSLGGSGYIDILGEGNDQAARLAAAVDDEGNLYVAHVEGEYAEWSDSFSYTNVIAKYSPSGSLLWQRPSPVGLPEGITVSSSGSIYVVGAKGVSRLTNAGKLTWTKPGSFDAVTISGSNLYTRGGTTIFKYDGNGNRLWERTQGGLAGLAITDMSGDRNGNVYLTGSYDTSNENRNGFVRKLDSSGSAHWTRRFGTANRDDARGIATRSSEIYVTGTTDGSLAHANRGGSDGYLRKMGASGNRLWTR